MGDLRRYGFSLLVAKGIWDEDAHLELIRADVPVDFEEETLREAEGFTPDESARLNLTHMAVFSIDDAATLDVDDALSVEATDEGLCIGVHIADVTAIVPIGTEVEKEARRRLMTLYLPERKIPMLPEVLSQGLCSLLESQRRCAVSFLYTLDRQLNVQDIRIVRSVIVNRFKLSYDAADQILSGDPHPLSEALQTLSQFVDVVYAQRVDRGAIELDRNEVAIRVDAEKHIEFRRRSGTSTAEHIVSEMMIYTNAAAARYFADHGIPAMYRRQAEPALKTVDNVVHESVKRYLFLRQLKPAELSLDPNPHATLGERLYCQITSPIRRYADLVLQRQLTAHLREEPIPYNRSALLDEISYQERTRELNRLLARREWYWLLRYVDEMPGLRIPCVVLEVRDREVVLELTEYGVRASMTPSGPLTAEDEIAVKAVQADAWTGMLKLTQIA
ncbi:MAG: RNB domain-containing ribonuclease [candidate division Zixibacteria bacterium]|nr:RNB domain-containing ribonuclease [candidate division Zixibacteria bacterium]